MRPDENRTAQYAQGSQLLMVNATALPLYRGNYIRN